MIYLDSAATSFYRPPEVAEAVVRAMESMGNSGRGVHGASLRTARTIYRARCLLAELFHGDGPEQTAFTANSTESLNLAVKGLLSPGDRAVTTVLEHNSVLRPLYEMEQRGVKLEIIGCGQEGVLDYQAMEQAIVPGVRAVFCTHASNVTGNSVDIRRIGRQCRKQGVLFCVDASQTAGRFAIDMERDCIDVLCFTGHKSLLGPQGTGGICVRRGIAVRPLVTGGTGIRTFDRQQPREMPEALEAGTLNGHGIAGLEAGLRYILEQGPEQLLKRERKLADLFLEETADIPGIRFYGDLGDPNRAPVVSLNLGERDSAEISGRLWAEYEISTRSGGHCAPLMHEALGTREQGTVRFSFSHYNTEQEIREAAGALREIGET